MNPPSQRPRLRLSTRLTLSFFAVIIATAGLVILLANRITVNRFSYMVSTTGKRQAERLAPLFADYYAQVGSWDGVAILMDAYAVSESMGHGGRGMRGYGASGMHSDMMLHDTAEHLVLLDATGRFIADNHHNAVWAHLSDADTDKGALIYVNEKHVGTLVIASALGTLTRDQNDFLRQVNTLMLIAGGVAGVAGLLVSGFQARRITAPVRALATAAHHIAKGDLSQRIPIMGGDELADMAAAFNTMASQLEEQHELRHRAMTDIAHELRTPLSVLQIDLESLEDGLLQATPETITGLQTEVAHLNHLVEDLRLLSLVAAGELRMNKATFDANTWACSVSERIRPVAREQNITLHVCPHATPLMLHGDAQRLSQVLLNLLTNALQHTPAGGTLTMSIYPQNDDVCISVQDSGAGIPPVDLPHVFERFYRTDTSRARHAGGSGLGLAIAHSLVAAHAGHIRVTSVENKGSIFVVALPMAQG